MNGLELAYQNTLKSFDNKPASVIDLVTLCIEDIDAMDVDIMGLRDIKGALAQLRVYRYFLKRANEDITKLLNIKN